MTEALYGFSRQLAGVVSLQDLLTVVVDRIAPVLSRKVVLLLPNEAEGLTVGAISKPDGVIDDIDLAAARTAWCTHGFERQQVRRIGQRLFYPLRTSHGSVGLIGLSLADGGASPSLDEERLLGALCDQAAVAIERIRLAGERDEARLAIEAERLRSALLTSLSHDLKTPLASITGAVTAMRQYADLYDTDARDELASTIQDEAERMTRFVGNLLDMTRLEAGGIILDCQPVDIGDIVGTALQRTARVLDGHILEVKLEPELPMLGLDVVLFEQVLVNILDNAAKYAPAGSRVWITGVQTADGVDLAVGDEGPGLASSDLELVFHKFYRAINGDRQRAGTGLGLAICRGFVEALGGKIVASSRTGRPGAVFTVSFPRTAFSALPDEASA